MKKVNNSLWIAMIFVLVPFTVIFIIALFSLNIWGMLISGVLGVGILLFWQSCPRCYIFDYDGVTFKYAFGFYKHFSWKKVNRIYRYYNHRASVFIIDGEAEGKTAFFTNDKGINITDKTEKYINRFYKGKIYSNKEESNKYQKQWQK